MKHNYIGALLLTLFAFLPTSVLRGQTPYSPVKTASISGRVFDNQGERIPAIVTAVAGPSIFSALTGSDGAFLLSGLPAGTYSLCAAPTIATWNADPLRRREPVADPFVDSCSSLDHRSQKVAVTTGEKFSGASVSLLRGKYVTVRINDPQKLLPSLSAKQRDESIYLHVVSRAGIVHRMPVLSTDATGQTHGFVIPFGESFRILVQSKAFRLRDDKGADPSIAPIAVLAARDGAAISKIFEVSTREAK